MYETIGYLFSFRFKDIQRSFGRNHHGLLNTIKSFVVLKSGFPPGKIFSSLIVSKTFFSSVFPLVADVSYSFCVQFPCSILNTKTKQEKSDGKVQFEFSSQLVTANLCLL